MSTLYVRLGTTELVFQQVLTWTCTVCVLRPIVCLPGIFCQWRCKSNEIDFYSRNIYFNRVNEILLDKGTFYDVLVLFFFSHSNKQAINFHFLYNVHAIGVHFHNNHYLTNTKRAVSTNIFIRCKIPLEVYYVMINSAVLIYQR